MCNGYVLKNIFNADEMGLFFSGLLTCSLVFKGDKAEKGKKSKEKITVLLACFAMLIPLVIGHSAKSMFL